MNSKRTAQGTGEAAAIGDHDTIHATKTAHAQESPETLALWAKVQIRSHSVLPEKTAHHQYPSARAQLTQTNKKLKGQIGNAKRHGNAKKWIRRQGSKAGQEIMNVRDISRIKTTRA